MAVVRWHTSAGPGATGTVGHGGNRDVMTARARARARGGPGRVPGPGAGGGSESAAWQTCRWASDSSESNLKRRDPASRSSNVNFTGNRPRPGRPPESRQRVFRVKLIFCSDRALRLNVRDRQFNLNLKFH